MPTLAELLGSLSQITQSIVETSGSLLEDAYRQGFAAGVLAMREQLDTLLSTDLSPEQVDIARIIETAIDNQNNSGRATTGSNTEHHFEENAKEPEVSPQQDLDQVDGRVSSKGARTRRGEVRKFLGKYLVNNAGSIQSIHKAAVAAGLGLTRDAIGNELRRYVGMTYRKDSSGNWFLLSGAAIGRGQNDGESQIVEDSPEIDPLHHNQAA